MPKADESFFLHKYFQKQSLQNINIVFWERKIIYVKYLAKTYSLQYIKPGFGFQATLAPLFSTYMPWIANDVSYYKEMSKRRYRIQVCILKYKKQCISSMLGLH